MTCRKSLIRAACCLLVSVQIIVSVAFAQPIAEGSAAAQQQRVRTQISDDHRVTLNGHRPAWAVAANDEGPVAASTSVRLHLLLARSPEMQAAFEQRLSDQQTPSSPLFHHWLTPTQIGQLYGLAPADLQAMTSWLTASGFHVDEVAPSGIFIEASAPAATVETTFQTALHLYRKAATDSAAGFVLLRGPASEPSIPAALAPVIAAIAGFSELPPEPLPVVHAVSDQTVQPQLTSTTGAHYLAPADFATIYDLNPLYNAGVTGTGSRVAIIGMSQVNPTDVSVYQTAFNLPPRPVNVVIPSTGADPGQTNDGSQSEATLDVDRVMGTAPGAQVDLVVSTAATGGNITAISYNVQTLLDPIMSISFGGGCEADASQPVTQVVASLFAQGAAEGISTFVSGGDSGANSCETHGKPAVASPPPIGINSFCASGFLTCVGGTEFADSANPSQYWNATNGTGRGSALGYIPEGVWNDPLNAATGVYQILAGGGGASNFYPKPAFQTGPGVPADGARDTPDLSLAASAAHDGYIFCYSNFGGGCVLDSTGTLTHFSVNGGTSASAPSMAGIAALLDQKLGGPQGNLNPLIYRIANRNYGSAFHDITPASSGVPAAMCTTAYANMCSNSLPSPSGITGGQPGFLLTTGYDQATGWGSLDVANFVAAATAIGTPSTATLSGSSGTFTGTQTLTFNLAVTGSGGSPTGTAQFFVNGIPTGTAVALNSMGQATYTVSSTALTSGTIATYGAFQVTATYSGDPTYEGSSSNPLALQLNPSGTANAALALTASSSSTDPTQTVTFMVSFTPGNSTATPTNNVSVYQVDGATLVRTNFQPLVADKYTFTLSGLAAGTHTYVASYPGDNNYAPVRSSNLTITSAALPTTTTLTGPATASAASSITLSATVTGILSSSASGSTTYVRFFDGGTLLGSSLPVFPSSSTTSTTSGTATLNVTLAAGTHSITAVWSGDSFTSASTSTALSVVSSAPGITFAAASSSLMVTAGGSSTDLLTLTSVGGYAGTAALSCAVTANGSQTVVAIPTCSLSSTTLTLAAGGTASATLTVNTTAAHAALVQPSFHSGGNGRPYFLAGLFALLPFAASRRRRAVWSRVASLSLICGCGAMLLLSAGCGSSASPTLTGGTSSGAYTVTISGGMGTTPTTLGTVNLTVQ